MTTIEVEVIEQTIELELHEQVIDLEIPQAAIFNDATIEINYKTNYDLAVDNGFVWTEQDYLDSLVWPQGEQGIQGAKWDKGDTGYTWPQGEQWPQGEIWPIWPQGDPTTITAWTGIEVDNTDPANPIISIDDTVITETSTDTLTNKTLDDYTNFIHADGIHLRVKATEALVKWDVIKFVWFNAGEQSIEVAKRNDINVPAIWVIYTASMTTGDFGMAVSNWLFKGINTSSFSVWDILYPNASGGFTATNPWWYAQQLAYVVRSHTVNGEIMINVWPVYWLDKSRLEALQYQSYTFTKVDNKVDTITYSDWTITEFTYVDNVLSTAVTTFTDATVITVTYTETSVTYS